MLIEINRIDNGLIIRTGGRPTDSDPLAQIPARAVFYADSAAAADGVRAWIDEADGDRQRHAPRVL